MVPTVLYEKRGSVVIITLTHPHVLNAINRHLKHELGESQQRFDAAKEAHVAIVTGAGTAFCDSRDLKERADDNASGISARNHWPDDPYMWKQPA